ncbi:hypothetical protein JCM5350_002272 [Sporobolomyces pararoseus]
MSSFASTSTSVLPPYPSALRTEEEEEEDSCDACYQACSTCSPQAIEPTCCPPLPPNFPEPLSPCSQFFRDCQACASHEGGIGGTEGGGGGQSKSHLAFCCDDEGCVTSTTTTPGIQEKGKSIDRSGGMGGSTEWEQMMFLDDCAQCVGDHQASGSMEGMNGLGIVDTSCCSTPWTDEMMESLEDCRSAGCFDSASTLPTQSNLPCRTPMSDNIQNSPVVTAGGGGGGGHLGETEGTEVNKVDFDSLLTGLDDSTIQDILNCCCCEEVLHDQPANFDPSSHTNHQRLPQHIHCDEHHHPAPRHHHPEAHNLSLLSYPHFSHQPSLPPADHGPSEASSASVHSCGWSGCHESFATGEELVLHVNSAHLALPQNPTSSLPQQATLSNHDQLPEPPSQFVQSQAHAAATLQEVPIGQLAQLDPVTALAIFSSVITNRPPSTESRCSLPSAPAHLPPGPSHSRPDRHSHPHSSRRHVHSHPYGVASIRKNSRAQLSGSRTPSMSESQSDYLSGHSTPFVSSPSRSQSVSTITSPAQLPLAPSSISHTPPSPSTSSSLPSPSHICRWRSCGISFSTSAELMEHLSTEHIGSGKSRYTCEWEGCERSTRACEERGDDEQEKDKKAFRQRQKVMRHLQMHTGDRPFACQVCGKTFSEALTLTQHMRVHTQERPYACDHPGCDKTFALASALTIHKRTHTGDRPFACPHPGCNAAFAESSNLSKHIRIHTDERRFICSICQKAFGRSDQLKRHGKVHERKNKKGKKEEIL